MTANQKIQTLIALTAGPEDPPSPIRPIMVLVAGSAAIKLVGWAANLPETATGSASWFLLLWCFTTWVVAHTLHEIRTDTMDFIRGVDGSDIIADHVDRVTRVSPR